MEHLREQFNSELNDEGVVGISGFTFQRDDILRTMEEVGYEEAFQEWILDRKHRFLESAESLLSHHDNGNRFDSLKRGYQSKVVIPFIGAGMSYPSNFPLWSQFLSNLRSESHVTEDSLNNHIALGDYEEAATLLQNDLGDALFDCSLEETFRRSTDIIGPINYLFDLFPQESVITTNFDPIIESLASKHLPNGFDKIQSGFLLSEALRLKSSGSRLLLKIHGDCDVVSGRVLVKSEYDRAYCDDGVVHNFLNRVLFNQSLLFLGCSLCEDRLLRKMKQFVSANDPKTLPRHYAFLELKESDDRVARKKHLAEANIFPIWYPEGEHDESIEALFLKLMEDE